ncbi:MAG: chorismate synthase [Pseudomonadota bacterium]|nr:chorismate synthase [Pseudomonadota bacterium]
MGGDSFGRIFKVTSFGESHGPAIGCVIDGIPPRIPLNEADIQPFLDKRKPGGSRHTSQRREADIVRILSGVYEGLTTGAPIALLIENTDARPKDYAAIAEQFRPGHADYSWWVKYGHRDPRGGGRSSARETAMRVAAGAVARKLLGCSIVIRAAVVSIGPHGIDRSRFDWNVVNSNPFFSPDSKIVPVWEEYLDDLRKRGTSAGAIVEVEASGVPAGLGEPVYDRLDADLAKASMSINAVRGVQIGDGFDIVDKEGHEAADEMRAGPDGRPIFLTNHAGGILGGISTGQPLRLTLALKPTPSISTPLRSIDIHGTEIEISTTGRHDPCVGIRAAPVAEAMTALVLADHLLRYKAILNHAP